MYNTRLRLVRGVVYSFFILAAIAVLGSCGMPFDWSLDLPDDWSIGDSADGSPTEPVAPEPQPQVMVITGDHFTLYWDESTEPVSEHRLYQRIHGESDWTLLVAGLNSPQATVTTADLAYGQHEFAVSFVDLNGTESELHTSLDATADPGTGWYLDWTGA